MGRTGELMTGGCRGEGVCWDDEGEIEKRGWNGEVGGGGGVGRGWGGGEANDW